MIRQHAGFEDLMKFIETPPQKDFRLSDDPQKHLAEHIFRSGRRAGHQDWQSLLTEIAPEAGLIPTSQKEQS